MADKLNLAYVTYTGIPQECLLSGTYTLTHGIDPGIISIQCDPFPLPYKLNGNVIFIVNGETLTLANCRLSEVQYTQAEDGTPTLTFQILDPRWRWKFSFIEGEYNILASDAEVQPPQILPTHLKEPHKLAELCLKAMGEKRFDVRALPNNVWPYVNWEGQNAAIALAELCDQLGCRVTWNPFTRTVVIVRLGEGQQLPVMLEDYLTDSVTANPPELPEQFTFHAGRTLHQVDLLLEAVGLEADRKTYVPIDQLSYRPKFQNGEQTWRQEAPGEMQNVAKKYRDIAKDSVYRVYRIKMPLDVYGEKIKSLDRILPMEDKLIEMVEFTTDRDTGRTLKKGIKVRGDAIVYGWWHSGDASLEDAPKIVQMPFGKAAIFERGFSIDATKGLVKFSEPVYRYVDAAGKPFDAAKPPLPENGPFYAPAKLFLRTAIGIRDEDTFAWQRQTVTWKPSGKRTGGLTHHISRDDVFQRTYSTWNGRAAIKFDNRRDVEKQAKYYLQQELRNFQYTEPGTRTYDGLLKIALDGALQQITWTVDEQGVPTTTLSRNTEHDVDILTYKERRRTQLVRSLIAKDQKNRTGKDRA